MIITYSQVSADSVASVLTERYAFTQPIQCKFYVLGLHDNYLVESGADKYIFRIYRNSWRTQEQIDFELELLAYLTERTSRVAAVLPAKGGELKIPIDCPEGQRLGALFAYAEGIAPGNAIVEEESLLLGQTVAAVHEITQGFDTAHKRPILDNAYLLDASLNTIDPFIEADARNYLHSLQDKLHRVLPDLPRDPGVFGICIGDVNPSNFHINEDKRITLFDFDQCGYGYRAFEIGKFISSLAVSEHKPKIAKAFIDGYLQVRHLDPAELGAIPYYEIVSVIWVMAIHAENAERIGYKLLERAYWERRLSGLKQLEEKTF